MKILILGIKDHGKDEIGKMLKKEIGLDYRSSSEIAGKECVYPVLAPKYGYTSWQECFDDRGNHRIEWRDLIREYCKDDKTRLAKKILSICDVYVGQRCHMEYSASKHLFDEILWVDASKRIGGEDESLTIEYDPTCMIPIDNNWSKSYTQGQLELLFG